MHWFFVEASYNFHLDSFIHIGGLGKKIWHGKERKPGSASGRTKGCNESCPLAYGLSWTGNDSTRESLFALGRITVSKGDLSGRANKRSQKNQAMVFGGRLWKDAPLHGRGASQSPIRMADVCPAIFFLPRPCNGLWRFQLCFHRKMHSHSGGILPVPFSCRVGLQWTGWESPARRPHWCGRM